MSTVLSLSGLHITNPAGRQLLDEAALNLASGEVVLLLGRNGSGKSTLLKLLAGLLDTRRDGWVVRGTARLGETAVELDSNPLNMCGYIFQDYALFDELSVGEHLSIAADHAKCPARPDDAVITSLLQDISLDQSVHTCSGGQRQRLAIARTLHSGHPVILYDEPNSGLDAALTRELAELIRRVARASGKPAVIAAHHYQHLLPVADRVLLFDSEESRLVEIEPDESRIEKHFLSKTEPRPLTDLAERADAAGETAAGMADTPTRIRLNWFAHFFAHYFSALVFSSAQFGYMAVGGLLAGFVSTWFVFRNSPQGAFFAPLLHDDALRAMGFVHLHVVVPLITGLLLAARNSAIISADIGHRVYSSQIAAMRNLHIPYGVYLVSAIIANTMIACLFFTVLNFFLCAAASMGAWRLTHPAEPAALWNSLYYDSIWPMRGWLESGLPTTFGKMACSGAAIGVVAAWFGFRRKTAVTDINTGIAVSVVVATSAVLAIHALFALIEF